MLKMYHERAHKGDSAELWEENWESTDFEAGLRFCENDPLRNLFERYAQVGKVMLEGGCGLGQYVAFYGARGVRIVGLDFAQSTLARLRKRYDQLMLCSGDVAALPFSDEAFDLYYSGGVVEHFEAGAEPALREARRVLKPDGVLLISVPYVNVLRRALSPFKSNLWRRVRSAEVEGEGSQHRQFFQYVYTRREFEALLASAGLRVIGRQGYGVMWGLFEFPFFGKIAEKLNQRVGSPPPDGLPVKEPRKDASAAISHPAPASSRSIIKRLVVNEDDAVPMLGLGVRFMRWAAANMMMYVCVPQGSDSAKQQ